MKQKYYGALEVAASPQRPAGMQTEWIRFSRVVSQRFRIVRGNVARAMALTLPFRSPLVCQSHG